MVGFDIVLVEDDMVVSMGMIPIGFRFVCWFVFVGLVCTIGMAASMIGFGCLESVSICVDVNDDDDMDDNADAAFSSFCSLIWRILSFPLSRGVDGVVAVTEEDEFKESDVDNDDEEDDDDDNWLNADDEWLRLIVGVAVVEKIVLLLADAPLDMIHSDVNLIYVLDVCAVAYR